MQITFPSGEKKAFDSGLSGLDIAQSISRSLAKKAIGVKVNGLARDLSMPIEQDSHLEVLTPQSPEGLEILRHSCAHLMAQAVKRLYPDVQVTIGPVIENGFYYDFATSSPFSDQDLEKIEQKMHEIAKEKLVVKRHLMQRKKAQEYFESLGENYKVEILEAIDASEELSFYEQGDFTDLCRGPHVPHTGFLKHFKLMKVAGAYWRGDHRNEQLQRIYGTCWSTEEELSEYVQNIELAKERDHRLIGAQMGLFHFQEEAQGIVFWHQPGWTLFKTIERKIEEFLGDKYLEVKTPQLVDRSLWEQSGHWEMFGENMFSFEKEDKHYAIKPMNCPCHIQIYKQRLYSYQDLPLRLSEFGSCHRYEPSGALHGLMRLRHFTQDDGHIFCTPEQILSEVQSFNKLLYKVYRWFGFENISVKLSTRPEKRVGEDSLWDKAEAALEQALTQSSIEFEIQEGEGAFYGPKIEFVLTDSLSRNWQCGTIQLDFSMPQKLGAYYVDSHGHKEHPVMIHRAVLGSLERFIGILLEHYAGRLPLELAPVQCVVIPVSEKFHEYARSVKDDLASKGMRVKIDCRHEKVGYKIRQWTLKKLPYFLILGQSEQENSCVSLRHYAGDTEQDLSIDKAIELMKEKSV